jgi:DNA polymerase-1
MISFSNGGRLVQDLSKLPNLKNSKQLYLDFETASFDRREKALKPYHGHKIAGICVTANEIPGAWYVPIRCSHKQWNLPLEPTLKWLKETILSCEEWVNHGVKFDAHFAKQDGIDFACKLVDTLSLAKVVQSDRYEYGLDSLSLEWLEEDISPLDARVQAYLTSCKSKDYGDVPGDIIGEYGCQDALSTRKLYQYLLRRRHEQTVGIWNTEIALTPVLFDMEVAGLRVDPKELMTQQFLIFNEMLALEEQLHKLTGIAMRPHTNEDCFEVLCNKYGLPVLGYSEGSEKKIGEPSFDKDILISYLSHPLVQQSPELTDVVGKIQRYRKLHTLNSFFVTPYQEHQINGLMHSDYNQIVRTGRMSCRRPNAQQLSSAAKAFIRPYDGCDLVRYDFSQIEFRLIVHYIQDEKAIAAYLENPNTDFHSWVAKMCGIPRRPAKNVNFCMGYGGGKKKVVSMLAANMELVGNLSAQVNELVLSGKIAESQRQQVFELLCTKRGEEVYQIYHDTLPGLKATTYRAARNLEARGYVFNAYGRQRHLPAKASFRAFNSIIQSCAADIQKERTVAIAPRYNKEIRDLGIVLSASVHDETLMNVPKAVSADPSALKMISEMFENTTVKFRVPIKVSCGKSAENWAKASSDENEIKFA